MDSTPTIQNMKIRHSNPLNKTHGTQNTMKYRKSQPNYLYNKSENTH